jgi:hypothetical protein
MSFEQLIVLALFVLLPLLESVVRKRRNRTRSQNGQPVEDVAQVLTARRSSPSPNWQGDEGLVQMENPEIILPAVRLHYHRHAVTMSGSCHGRLFV